MLKRPEVSAGYILRLVPAVAVLALLIPATATATIVVQRSIMGVELGMTQAQVRGKLGRPAKVIQSKNDFGPYVEFRYAQTTVDFQGNESVTAIQTTSKTERGPHGVGIGSTKAQVRAAVPGLKCEGTPAAGQCYVGKYLPGGRVTAFYFSGGKVDEVVLGYVID